MNTHEQLTWLVEAFKEDSVQYRNLETPATDEEKRRLLRSLMNIRLPKRIDPEILKVQDSYLQERAKEKNPVHWQDMPEIRKGISLWQGDITRIAADAIVNAANSQMLGCFIPMHTCIDNPMLN